MERLIYAGRMDSSPEPHQMRISDEDRHKVAEVLRQAAGEGRIDLDELDERLEATYAAKTYADLVPITVDLPAKGVEPVGRTPANRPSDSGAVAHAPTYASSVTIMGGQDRKGIWKVDGTHTATAVMGGIGLDLRQAVFTDRETVINANAVMGSVDVVVNAYTNVIVDGVGIMGDFSQARDRVEPQLGPDSPVVRVKGIALMGAVTVVRKRMPGEPRRPGRPRLHK